MNESTQLTTASGYDTSRMTFSDAQVGSIPGSMPAINYKRITIKTTNEDGSIGDLVLPTSKLFSFGVSENTSIDTGKVNGYSMPLCLWSKDGATDEEKEWSTTFDAIVEKCKEHLIAVREEIEQYDLVMSDLKKLNPLYYKKEKGKVVEGTGPTLYPKLLLSKKLEKIVTMFFDFEGSPIDPLTLIGKYCFTKSAVKIESIFIGNKISMQIKLYECEVKLMETGMKKLLKRPTAVTSILSSTDRQSLPNLKIDIPPTINKAELNDDNGSVHDSDDETAKETAKKPPAKTRVVKKVLRKVAQTE